MLSFELKEATREAHQALEAVVVRQIKSIRNKVDYAKLLHKFYGFHHPMDLVFHHYFNDSIIPFYSKRRKAEEILVNLKNLGADTGDIELAKDLPCINSPAKAFGGFYVLEGSTQGGAIVADMLIKYGGLSPETTSFFNIYGDKSKEMWQSFKNRLDECFNDDDRRGDVADAANETFLKFREWMLK